jgi:hypothetical protein
VEAIAGGILRLGIGALYGALFGKAFSARRLRSVGSLLTLGTSLLMAWVDLASPLSASALDAYTTPVSQRLVLNFNSGERAPKDGMSRASVLLCLWCQTISSTSRTTVCSSWRRRRNRGDFSVRPVRSVATAFARKHAAPAAVFQFTAAWSSSEPVAGTT